jgi:hypothetical protein
MEYCKNTGKQIFRTKNDANLVIKRKRKMQKNVRNRKRKPEINAVYSYNCAYCGFWHLAGK